MAQTLVARPAHRRVLPVALSLVRLPVSSTRLLALLVLLAVEVEEAVGAVSFQSPQPAWFLMAEHIQEAP